MDYQTVTPAYGRDYKSAKAAKADWAAGKDFVCQPQGCYINKEDADKEPNMKVMIRYDRLTKIVGA